MTERLALLPQALPGRARWRARTIRRALTRTQSKVAVVLLLLIVFVCALGPAVSPHGPAAIVGVPFGPPSRADWLGTDYLGRDVLSRFLNGGRSVLVVSVLATLLAYTVAVPLGIFSGLRRGVTDLAVVGVSDVVYALPPIIFLLVLLSAVGTHLWAIVVGIAAVHTPRALRVVRLVTIDLSSQEFVEAAIARGERTIAICFRDILPNTISPVLADFGVRLSVSIIMFASLSYLGLGPAPPAADWGLMISENRIGITTSPWIVIAPAVAIALFAVSVNLIADAFARSVGPSEMTRRA